MIRLYLITLVSFFAIDIVWLAVVAKDLYRKHIGFIMADSPNWFAGGAFYLIYIAGLVFFAVKPAVDKGDWQVALLYGALFGFFTYATYDLTNLATLKDWPLAITIIDLVWGTCLGGATSVLAFFLHRWMT